MVERPYPIRRLVSGGQVKAWSQVQEAHLAARVLAHGDGELEGQRDERVVGVLEESRTYRCGDGGASYGDGRSEWEEVHDCARECACVTSVDGGVDAGVGDGTVLDPNPAAVGTQRTVAETSP